jgi:hypothetical protein
LSSDWIFGASYASLPGEILDAPVFLLGKTYAGNHVTAANLCGSPVKLTARVIARPEDNTDVYDGSEPPLDEERQDWSDPESARHDWRDVSGATAGDADWDSHDYERDGGFREARTVLERTDVLIRRISGAYSAPVAKDPEQPGLADGTVLDMGEIEPGESATYEFFLTLNGRRFLNASQRARVVFYLDFSAVSLGEAGPAPTPPPTPTPALSPTEAPGQTPGLPAGPGPGGAAAATPAPASLATASPAPTPAVAEEPEERQPSTGEPEKDGGPPEQDPLATAAPIVGGPSGGVGVGDAYKETRPVPKTGDARMRLYAILLLISLIVAYVMLRKKKDEEAKRSSHVLNSALTRMSEWIGWATGRGKRG